MADSNIAECAGGGPAPGRAGAGKPESGWQHASLPSGSGKNLLNPDAAGGYSSIWNSATIGLWLPSLSAGPARDAEVYGARR